MHINLLSLLACLSVSKKVNLLRLLERRLAKTIMYPVTQKMKGINSKLGILVLAHYDKVHMMYMGHNSKITTRVT